MSVSRADRVSATLHGALLPMMIRLPLAAALSLCLSSAFADEGMWTFNNFPAAKVGQAYGFAPDQAWLDHVRMSSVRLARGRSGSSLSAGRPLRAHQHR